MKKEKAPEEALIEKQNKDSDFSQFLQAYDNLFHAYENDERYEDVPCKYRHPVGYLCDNIAVSLRGQGMEDKRPTDATNNGIADIILSHAVRLDKVFRWSENNTFVYRNNGEWVHGNLGDLVNIVSATNRLSLAGDAYWYGKAPNEIATIIYKEMCENEDYKYTSEEKDEAETEVADWDNEPLFVAEEGVEPTATLAKIGDTPVFPTTGINAQIGKQKTGKTTFCWASSLALINGEPFGGFAPVRHVERILFVDTEQSLNTISQRLRTFRKQLKRPKAFQVLSVKYLPIQDRMTEIERVAQKYKTDIIYIDGIVDLVANFNEVEPCKELFERLGKLATDRLVVCLLHENKMTDLARGHLGSFLMQKAEESWRVKRENGLFKVSLFESRHADTTDVEPIVFGLDREGYLADRGTMIDEAADKEKQAFYGNLQRIYMDETELRHKDIVFRLKECDKLEKSAANNKIARAVALGILKKSDPNNSHSPYILVAPD